MNTDLLSRLVRIQSELNAIMMELASAPTSVPVAEPEKKGSQKVKKERDPNKPKKVLSPEHLAKLKEGRERRAAEKAATGASSSDSSDDAKSVASSSTEEGEVKDVTAPPAPKKVRGRPRKITDVPPAPDFSAADAE
jgi:hypothetical protein